MMIKRFYLAAVFLLALLPSLAEAGEADVIAVKVRRSGVGLYDFDVTIRSNDTGWSYFADRFDVLTPDGQLLGSRTLLHPHDDEQPFTRDLYGVRIPPGISEVTVRAHHNPKGLSGTTQSVTLPK